MANKFNAISFKELDYFNDNNSIMFLGCDFGDMTKEEAISEMDKWLHEINMIKEDKHVEDIKFLVGNVNGENGRKDWLIVFDSGISETNPMVRLAYSRDFKWISDFIHNYKDDYERV